jgi:hypothetical protein
VKIQYHVFGIIAAHFQLCDASTQQVENPAREAEPHSPDIKRAASRQALPEELHS